MGEPAGVFSMPIIDGCSQVILQNKVTPEVQGSALGGASLLLAYVCGLQPLGRPRFRALMRYLIKP
jgi:hypothetical protein